MLTTFQLDSGRSVSIEIVSIRNTYGNMDGDRASMVAEVWKQLPTWLETHLGPGALILRPKTEAEEWFLPVYTFAVMLSSEALPGNVGDFQSDLSLVTLCWFQKKLEGNLVDFIRQAATGLEWEKHARNWGL